MKIFVEGLKSHKRLTFLSSLINKNGKKAELIEPAKFEGNDLIEKWLNVIEYCNKHPNKKFIFDSSPISLFTDNDNYSEKIAIEIFQKLLGDQNYVIFFKKIFRYQYVTATTEKVTEFLIVKKKFDIILKNKFLAENILYV